MKLNMHFAFLIFSVMKCLPLLSSTWATPVLEHHPADPLIVFSKHGNILEISHKKEDPNLIQAQVYHQETNQWSQPIDLSDTCMSAHHPKIATDPDGNAIAMWQVIDGGLECIQAAFYNASTDRWTPSQNLTEFEKGLVITHLAMNEKGDAFAAWKQGDKRTSKTATYSRASNKWGNFQSCILPSKTYHKNNRIILDIKNNKKQL
jgi:hypothetical protein